MIMMIMMIVVVVVVVVVAVASPWLEISTQWQAEHREKTALKLIVSSVVEI